MRKGIIFWLLLLPIVLMAAPVTQEQAMQKARVFVNGHSRMAQGGKLKVARAPLKLQSAQTTASYYVFNVGERQGFVIASGDDRTPAILGYADDGQFDADNIPSNMKAWLEDYERQISLLDKYPAAQAMSTIREAIDPLVTSRWNQDSPYNDLCPIDPLYGKHSATGCEATANAQIMNYYKYPDATKAAIPAYQTYTYGMNLDGIPANIPIDWDNILDIYDESATEAQRQAIAQLMMLCGYAAEMDYTFEGSGAYTSDAALALYTIFGYDKNISVERRAYYRAAEWDELIYNELQERRPVQYSGVTAIEGHAFIVDGYDGDGLYHVNWGWGGDCNGYFLLSVLDPYQEGSDAISYDGFSSEQMAIIGIQKPLETAPDEGKAIVTKCFFIDSYEREFQRQPNGTFSIPVYIEMWNSSVLTNSFDIGFSIYDAENQKVDDYYLVTFKNIPPNYYDYKRCKITLPADLSDGKYTIKVCCKVTGTDKWLLGHNDFSLYIDVIIDGDVVTASCNEGTYDVSGTIVSTTEQPTVGSEVRLEATIKNNGYNLTEEPFLFIDGKAVSEFLIEVESGKTTSIKLSYVPTRSGANDAKVILKTYAGDLVFAQGTINVLGRETPELLFDLGIKDLRENNSVAHTDIDVDVNIHNNSRNAYNDNMGMKVFKKNPNGSVEEVFKQMIPIELEGDSDTLLHVPVNGLENLCNYFVAGFYRDSIGEFQYNSSEVLKFLTNIPTDGREDLTCKIMNPDFEQGKYGWTIDALDGGNVRADGNDNNRCFEAWNSSQFDVHQNLTDLPAGLYEIQMQGFYWYLSNNDALYAWQNGTINSPVYVYMGNSVKPLMNMFDDHAEAGFYSNDKCYKSPTGLCYPINIISSGEAFNAGMYQQSTYALVTGEEDEVRIGVKGATNQGGNSWAIWDNFKLTYLGFNAEYIQSAMQQAIVAADKLITQFMSPSAYEQLTSVLTEAKAVEQSADSEQMFQMLNRLYKANEQATYSVTAFQSLANALTEFQWSVNNCHVASAAVQQEAADLLAEVTAKVINHQYEESDVAALVAQIEAEMHLLRMPENMELATAANPVECTSLLDTPSFEHNGRNAMYNWILYGTCDFGNDDFQRSAFALEALKGDLMLYQFVLDIPNGYYGMQVSGFYRYGTVAQDAEYHRKGIEPSDVYLAIGDPTTPDDVYKPIKLLSSEYSEKRLSNGDEVNIAKGRYVPNDLVSSVAYFQAGYYQNTSVYETKSNGLYMGVLKDKDVKDDWLVLDDFRLFYYGTEKPDDPQVGIAPMTLNPSPITTTYDLQGRRVTASQKGLVIRRELRPDGTVLVRKVIK